MKEIGLTIQGVLTGTLTYISAKLGILGPVLVALCIAMGADYVTGMLASKAEAVDHPGDPAYGWSSKKGLKGILKKVGYICVVGVAMGVDYIIISVACQLGYQIPRAAIFGLLVSVWYLLNEFLSIIENAGRMGAPVPEWLAKYISDLKDKVDEKAEE